MGASYVRAALAAARVAKLGHAATRALVGMAVTVRDKPGADGEPEGLYFGGRIALAMDLGYGADDPAAAENTAAERAVDRAVSECKAAGLVRIHKIARAGGRTEYDLRPLLDVARRSHALPVDNSESGPR